LTIVVLSNQNELEAHVISLKIAALIFGENAEIEVDAELLQSPLEFSNHPSFLR